MVDGTVITTTISIFSGATPLGTLSYTGAPDSAFTGGFAEIQSAIAFDRAEVTFNSVTPPSPLDNVRFTNLPEPGPISLVMIGLGLRALWALRAPRQLRRLGHLRR